MEFHKEEFKLLWKVYLAELLRGIGAFIVPFMFIFLQNKSLSLAQIGFLLGVVSLTNFFLEIPTGVIADRYGRKFSALLGFSLSYLSFFLMIFTDSYFFLLFLYFLHGVGFTFISGAYDGWIYEYLKSHKKEKYMHNFLSRRLSFSYLGLILAGLIGGYLVSFLDLSWLIVLDTLFGAFFLYFLFQIPDPPILQKKSYVGFKQFFETAKSGFMLVRNNKNLLLLILASMFFTFAVGAKDLLSQPAYVELGTPLPYLGYVAAVSGLIIFTVPNLLLKWSKKHSKTILLLFTFLEFLFIGSIFFVHSYFLFALFLTLSFLCGAIISPITDSIFQHHSKTEVRATVMSLLNMLISLVFFVVFFTAGILADMYSAKMVLAVSSLFILPAMVCYFLLKE